MQTYPPSELERWLKCTLPELNASIDGKHASPDDFIRETLPLIMQFHERIQYPDESNSIEIDINEARYYLQLLGFIFSSCEKHFQSNGFPPGFGIRCYPYAEQLCKQLSRVARHPPRDSAYTYWIWNNSSELITFTNNPQEVFFNQVVNGSHNLLQDCDEELRNICNGNIELTSGTAQELVIDAANNLLKARSLFLSFLSYTDETHNSRKLETTYFITGFRTYLVTYPIDGKTWKGISAANLAPPIQLDFLVGTVDQTYRDHVAQRFENMPVECVNEIQQDILRPSLLDLILASLRLTDTEVLLMRPGNLQSWIAENKLLAGFLRAYKNLLDAAARLTAVHWTLVSNYLIKPATQMNSAEMKRMSVLPTEGTSGITLDEAKAMMDMRRHHPVAAKLSECIG